MKNLTIQDKCLLGVLVISIIALIISIPIENANNLKRFAGSNTSSNIISSQSNLVPNLVQNTPTVSSSISPIKTSNIKEDISKLLNLSIDQIKEKFPKILELNNGTTKALIYEKDNIKMNFESYKGNKIEYIQITDSKLICKDNSELKNLYKEIVSSYGFDLDKIKDLKTEIRNNGVLDILGYGGNTYLSLSCSRLDEPRVVNVTYFNNPN